MQEEGKLQEREKLPKFLSGHNFLIESQMKVERDDDEGEGLVEVDGKDTATHKVAMVSDKCDIKIGDEVIMSPMDMMQRVRMAFSVGDKEYFMYSEHDIQGVW